MMGLLVEEKCRVAEHAHVLDAAQDALLVDLREPALAFPFAHERGQNIALLAIRLGLLRGQRNAEDLVGALGQILQYLRARAPQQDRRQLS